MAKLPKGKQCQAIQSKGGRAAAAKRKRDKKGSKTRLLDILWFLRDQERGVQQPGFAPEVLSALAGETATQEVAKR